MKKPKTLRIVMTTVDVGKHRYPSADDYTDPVIKDDEIKFATTIINMGNSDYEFLVFMHAITEQYLCWKHGIKDKEITKFDMDHPELDDPGNSPDAPYNHEHEIATEVEALLSQELRVSWIEYEKTIDKALKKYPKKK